MEVIESLKKSIEERLNSPVFGTFVFSWIICNWEFIYTTIFISEEYLKVNKLIYVKTRLSKDIWDTFGYPFIYTLLILLLIPILKEVFTLWKLKSIQIFKKSKIKVQGETPISKNKAKELNLKVNSQVSQIKDLTDHNESLRELNKELTNEIEEFKTLKSQSKENKTSEDNSKTQYKTKNDDNDKISDLDYNIFKTIYKKMSSHLQHNFDDNIYVINNIVKTFEKDLISTELLNFLASRNLIVEVHPEIFTLTKKGLTFNNYLKAENFIPQF